MTEQATQDAVRKSVVVPLAVDRAFALFTEQIGSWWPREYQIGRSAYETAFVEPRAGGRWYERGSDGSECDWGRVLAFDPPHSISLTWQIGADWQYDPDPEHGSIVDVRFTADGDGTRVELTHHGFDRHPAGGNEVRSTVGGPSGWGLVLSRFQARASA